MCYDRLKSILTHQEVYMLSQKCITWYNNVFKTTKLFEDMTNCVEGSPWHRERNVGVHTDMVVNQYLITVAKEPDAWDMSEVIGFLSCVFHDVGKPAAKIEKHSEARGKYFAFHGHEQMSSRLWEDYVMTNSLLSDLLGLTPFHIWGISWIIEHHVPWATKDKRKRDNYAKSVIQIFQEDGFNDAQNFCSVLMADTYGRISDDADDKIAKSIEWCDEFYELLVEHGIHDIPVVDNTKPILHVPIAATGTGKSTYFNNMPNKAVDHFSLDELRLAWYDGDDYGECFKLACEDKDFAKKANSKFINMLSEGNDIYVDNCNISTKSRRFYIDEARKKGYRILAITFPISKVELNIRVVNRRDKNVGYHISESMYDRIQQPSFGEFDHIVAQWWS